MADPIVLGYWGIRGLAQPCMNLYHPFSEIHVRVLGLTI